MAPLARVRRDARVDRGRSDALSASRPRPPEARVLPGQRRYSSLRSGLISVTLKDRLLPVPVRRLLPPALPKPRGTTSRGTGVSSSDSPLGPVRPILIVRRVLEEPYRKYLP